MFKPRKFLSPFLFLPIFALATLPILAQDSAVTQAENSPFRSYEAVLYVLSGSDDAVAGNQAPNSIGKALREIKDNFSFRNYRLINTYFGRVGDRGSLGYKSLSASVGNEAGDLPTFLEWQFSGFISGPSGSDSMRLDSFHFGARVPVKTATFADPQGKTTSTVNYENIGLTLGRMGLRANTPTLIGTISLPKAAGTLFLVLSIRPAE